MSRLIDADELIARAEHEAKGMSGDFKDLFVPTLNWLIDKTSTAYDVDKVVEELGKSTKESHGNAGMGGEMVVNLDDAIEIVKQGHVENNEPVNDKCEWRKSKEYPYDWMVGCDGCEVTHKQGAYCPRCGKKIKLVE